MPNLRVYQTIRGGVAAVTAHHALFPNFPVPEPFGWSPGRDRVTIGTAFLAYRSAEFGIVLTARHVVGDFVERANTFDADRRKPEIMALVLHFQADVHMHVGQTPQQGVKSWVRSVVVAPTAYLLDDATDVAALIIGPMAKNADPELTVPVSLDLAKGEAMIGEDVVTCGFPFGEQINAKHSMGGSSQPPTFSHGIVGAILPDWMVPPPLRTVFRYDAQTLQGNSGGPVCERVTGRVVGIASTVTVQQIVHSSPRSHDDRTAIPVGFPEAVPLFHVRRMLDRAKGDRESGIRFQAWSEAPAP